jgi:hypothetical protein
MTTNSQPAGSPQSEQIHQSVSDEAHVHDGGSGLPHSSGEVQAPHPLGSLAAAGAHHHPQQSMLSRVWRFLLHYVEMCLAMCIGGIPLNVLFFLGAAQLGYPDLIERFPELSILMIGILLALPMAAWMRFRGHDWRSNLEMSGSTIILAIVLIGAAWIGALPRSGLLEWIRGLACPVMLIPMLLRLDLYTGHHAAHSQRPAPRAI